MNVGIKGLQKKTLESLELKPQRAVSCRVRVMERNLGLLQEQEVLFILLTTLSCHFTHCVI